MVETSAKIDEIVNNYIERDEYFAINRSRQFGKTTTLNLLRLGLADDYLVIDSSFEATLSYFESLSIFVEAISVNIKVKLAVSNVDLSESYFSKS